MHIGYIIAIAFGVIWLVFKIIDAEKARKAQIEELKKSDKNEV